MASRPLSSVDAAWLRMEDPTNLMMVTGLMTFDGPVSERDLRKILEERLLAFPRFRQRVHEAPFRIGTPTWRDDPHFDIQSHIHRVALPAPGDRAALEELVGDLMSTPLDMTKPLWQVHLIEGVGKGSALLSRIHHCIADGIALVHVMLSLTDTSPHPKPRPPREVDGRRGPDLLARADALVEIGAEVAAHPEILADWGSKGVESAATLARLVALPPDPPTVFKGPLGVTKRAAWSDSIAIDRIKEAGKRHGATINDVLINAAAGSLRRYLRDHRQPVAGLEIRAAVPVNLRPLGSASDLGNSFGIVFLGLPLGIADPILRMAEIKRRMDAIKGSLEAGVSFAVLNGIGLLPAALHPFAVQFFGSKATAVMTNVPGPHQPLYLAGRRIDQVMFWVPQSGRLGLGISILSYAGSVMVGVNTDAGLVPDPERLVTGFHEEIELICAEPKPRRASASRTRKTEA